jgi:hypothetical protein
MSTPAAFQEGSAEQCTGGIRSTTWHHGSPSVALVTTDESNAIHFGRSREGQVTLGPAQAFNELDARLKHSRNLNT